MAYHEFLTAVGRAAFDNNEFSKALAAYEHADTATMSDYDLRNYAMSAYFKKRYWQGLNIARYGLQHKPGDIHFARIAFFCATDLKQYDDAQRYADKLFNNTTPLSYYDHAYLVRLLATKHNLSETDRQRMKESCHYLMNYYTTEKPTPRMVRHYAKRLLTIDPNDTQAKQALNK